VDDRDIVDGKDDLWLDYAREGGVGGLIEKKKKDGALERVCKQGYAIDMPLSEQGSWLRIAVPCPGDKDGEGEFQMRWVFVPFGSCLVRSMLLVHSGHYGLPGNARFHGTLVPKVNDNVLESHLGYLTELVVKRDELKKWKLTWAEEETKLMARSGNGHQSMTNAHIKLLKERGSKYFEIHYENTCVDETVKCIGVLSPWIGDQDKVTPKAWRKTVMELDVVEMDKKGEGGEGGEGERSSNEDLTNPVAK
jgi:hypothetical protein